MKKNLLRQLICFGIGCLIAINSNAQSSLLQVSGKYLLDDCGDTVILKGVNDMNFFDTNWGLAHFREIAKTGANTVRIQIESGNTIAQIQSLLDSCLTNKMIPILEMQQFTGEGNGDQVTYGGQPDTVVLSQAAAFWTNTGMKNLLLTYQNYLIINLANEPNGAWNVTPSDQISYFNANKTAIEALRTAGYTCPIMIDGMNWAHDVSFFTNYGLQLLNNDPLHNLLFSVHSYWPQSDYSDAAVTSLIDQMGTSGLPMLFGEFAWSTSSDNITYYPNNYDLILQKAHQYNIGWLVWVWGDENDYQYNNNSMVMSTDGSYAGLDIPHHGKEFAVTHQYSIQNTARRPYKLIHGVCETTGIKDLQNDNDLKIYPNPAGEILTLESTQQVSSMEIQDLSGKIVWKQDLGENHHTIIYTGNWANGIYVIKVTDLNGNMHTSKIIKGQ
ncbi:cellulase family glycosylhydrolase [Fluviicola sp.]|jgi:mannan endo-1,4-beta-mannosidase|uniref:cellulase family glycosylhydrolase n=1 Tax=Fluviicola sp. TaxID=1917219 RepID=UPI002826AF35|nr:cellulase family glycosylhydrolase [Fluviicola sp.]MDR0803301.1 cellulase family glycosylhydrolase [Fluviicola sp.]